MLKYEKRVKDFARFSYFATYLTSLQPSEIIAQYEKRKYLPKLHEATCANHYFIIKCLLETSLLIAM